MTGCFLCKWLFIHWLIHPLANLLWLFPIFTSSGETRLGKYFRYVILRKKWYFIWLKYVYNFVQSKKMPNLRERDDFSKRSIPFSQNSWDILQETLPNGAFPYMVSGHGLFPGLPIQYSYKFRWLNPHVECWLHPMNHESHSIPALWENHGQITENMGKNMGKKH